jgi:hypothetical protein
LLGVGHKREELFELVDDDQEQRSSAVGEFGLAG